MPQHTPLPRPSPDPWPAAARDPRALAQLERNLRGAGMARRRFLALAGAISGAAALAACGEDVAPTSTPAPTTAATRAATTAPTVAAPMTTMPTTAAPAASTASTAPPTAPTAPTAANTANTAAPAMVVTAAMGPESKKVFIDYLTAEPTDNDFNRDLYCGGTSSHMAGLLRYDPDFNLIPELAESYSVAADGKTYTFKLRPGIQWSDGVPIKASDFAYSVRRQIDPRTGNGYASFWNGVIRGAKEFSGAKADDPNLETLRMAVGVRAVDDATLEIIGGEFAALVPGQAAYTAAMVAREDMVKKYADAKELSSWTDPGKTGGPILAGGAFQITEWKHQQSISLVRNDKYWNAKSIRQKYVQVKIIPDLTKSVLSFDNGDVDYQVVPATEVDRIKADAKYRGLVYQYIYPSTRFLVPDTGKAPFDKLEVRKATILAIDKDRLVNQVGRKIHTVAHAMTAPGVFGYFDDDDNKLKNTQKFDKAAALEALKGTTFEGGRNWPKITMSYNSSDLDIPTGYPDEIARQLRETLGMTVELEPLETKAFNARRFALDLQLILYRWAQDYPDPHNQYYQVWALHTKGSARQSYTDSVFDELSTKAAAETDKAKRLDLYYQAEMRLLTQFAYMPIHWRTDNYLIKPYAQNFPKNKQGYVVPNTNIFNRAWNQIFVSDDSPHDPGR